MKKILLGIIVATVMSCSTDWNFVNTGLAKEHFDGTMYEYFQSNRYDWDSVRVMVEHADLVDLFNGSEPITFFGPTNISIRKWMNKSGYATIRELDKDLIKTKILDCVCDGKILRDEVPEGDFVSQERIGGKEYTFKSGKTIWVYRYRLSDGAELHAGAAILYLQGNVSTDVASTNIQPTNGVVHSLSYNYVFGTL